MSPTPDTPVPAYFRNRDVLDSEGMPNFDYGLWHSYGSSCRLARLNKHLRKLALQTLIKRHYPDGQGIEHWMLRAFADGASRPRKNGPAPWTPEGFVWPTPPDAAWEVVACVYPDGVEIDMVHPVSRRFWSEDNDHFQLPEKRFTRGFCERMGIPVILMSPDFVPAIAPKKKKHLSLAHSA